MNPAKIVIIYAGVAVIAITLFISFGGVIESFFRTHFSSQENSVVQTTTRSVGRYGYAGYGGGYGMGMGTGSAMSPISATTIEKELEQNQSGFQEMIDLKSGDAKTAPERANSMTISIAADIDGGSVLLIHRNHVRWYHSTWAAPGREKGNQPTIINGNEWLPNWSNTRSNRNDSCKCVSNIYSGLSPALWEQNMNIHLNIIQSRGSVKILQEPSKENNYVLAVLFDDNSKGGSALYEIELEISKK